MISKILVLVIPVFIGATAQIFFRKGMLSLGRLDFSFSGVIGLIPKILQSWWLMAGIILFGMGFLVYLLALSKIQLSVAYPIFVSLAMVVVALASWFFMKETLTGLQIFGMATILFGVFLLAQKGLI